MLVPWVRYWLSHLPSPKISILWTQYGCSYSEQAWCRAGWREENRGNWLPYPEPCRSVLAIACPPPSARPQPEPSQYPRDHLGDMILEGSEFQSFFNVVWIILGDWEYWSWCPKSKPTEKESEREEGMHEWTVASSRCLPITNSEVLQESGARKKKQKSLQKAAGISGMVI